MKQDLSDNLKQKKILKGLIKNYKWPISKFRYFSVSFDKSCEGYPPPDGGIGNFIWRLHLMYLSHPLQDSCRQWCGKRCHKECWWGTDFELSENVMGNWNYSTVPVWWSCNCLHYIMLVATAVLVWVLIGSCRS